MRLEASHLDDETEKGKILGRVRRIERACGIFSVASSFNPPANIIGWEDKVYYDKVRLMKQFGVVFLPDQELAMNERWTRLQVGECMKSEEIKDWDVVVGAIMPEELANDGEFDGEYPTVRESSSDIESKVKFVKTMFLEVILPPILTRAATGRYGPTGPLCAHLGEQFIKYIFIFK